MLVYTSWHQLLVYSCNSWLLSSFMLLCSYPLVICLSCYLVILWLQFILLLFCAHCLYARAFPFTHTHTHQVAFWRPWICTSRYWTLFSIVQVFFENVRFAKSGSFSLFDSGILSFLYSCYYFWFMYITLGFYSIPYFIWDHV